MSIPMPKDRRGSAPRSRKGIPVKRVAAMRMLPKDRKKCFKTSLRQLIDVLGLNLKLASEEMQVSYRWLRRMVSEGISQKDKRNIENLQKVAGYFALPEIDLLWTVHLVSYLVASEDGRDFVAKFETHIDRLVQSQTATSDKIDSMLLETWKSVRAEGGPSTTVSYEKKLDFLLATGKYEPLKQINDACRRLVDEAYERESRKCGAKNSRTG
jgi:hypothetical protein